MWWAALHLAREITVGVTQSYGYDIYIWPHLVAYLQHPFVSWLIVGFTHTYICYYESKLYLLLQPWPSPSAHHPQGTILPVKLRMTQLMCLLIKIIQLVCTALNQLVVRLGLTQLKWRLCRRSMNSLGQLRHLNILLQHQRGDWIGQSHLHWKHGESAWLQFTLVYLRTLELFWLCYEFVIATPQKRVTVSVDN